MKLDFAALDSDLNTKQFRPEKWHLYQMVTQYMMRTHAGEQDPNCEYSRSN